MRIGAYKTTNFAATWAINVGVPAATIFATSTIVGRLVNANRWFTRGLVIGTVMGGFSAYAIRNRIPEPIRAIVSFLVPLHIELNRAGEEAFLDIMPQFKPVLRVVAFVRSVFPLAFRCFEGGFIAFLVGRYLLPRLVALGSGLTAGSSLGVTAVILPPLVLEKAQG